MVGSGRGGGAASNSPLFVKIGSAGDNMGCVLELGSLSQFRSLCCGVNSPIFGPIHKIGNFVGYPLWSPVRGRILWILAAAMGFEGRR